jgi:hypothetical protein
MPGKYEGDNEARDEALHQLCTGQWANESDGHVEAPTGFFWRITITEAELAEVAQALDSPEPEGLATADLVGAFLVTEDTQGFVHVTRYPDQYPDRTGEDRALVAFQAKQRAYTEWSAAE